MSSKQSESSENKHNRHEDKEHRRRGRSRERQEPESESDEDVIDLCDDHDYQVLSAVLETEKGYNLAEILSKIQKDVHLLATSVHQLIQLSIAAQQAAARAAEESDAGECDDEDDE